MARWRRCVVSVFGRVDVVDVDGQGSSYILRATSCQFRCPSLAFRRRRGVDESGLLGARSPPTRLRIHSRRTDVSLEAKTRVVPPSSRVRTTNLNPPGSTVPPDAGTRVRRVNESIGFAVGLDLNRAKYGIVHQELTKRAYEEILKDATLAPRLRAIRRDHSCYVAHILRKGVEWNDFPGQDGTPAEPDLG